MKNLLSALAGLGLLVATPLFANPIEVPPRMETLRFDIQDDGGNLTAAFNGEFMVQNIPSPPATLSFPVPAGTTNFVVTEDAGTTPSGSISDVYLTPLHPTEPQMQMMEWSPDYGAGIWYFFDVDYDQPVIPVGNLYLCFYALGCARHVPVENADMSVGIFVNIPDGYHLSSIRLDNTPITYRTEPDTQNPSDDVYIAEISTEDDPITQDLYIYIAQGTPTNAASWELYY